MRARAIVAAAALAAGCASTEAPDEKAGSEPVDLSGLAMILGRSAKATDETIAAVEAAGPLGSEANPVRADMPPGQRAYMARLRCLDGAVPDSSRAGSAGGSPYGGVLDIYQWSCPDGASGSVYIDMYHPGHVERRAPDGSPLRSANGA